MLVTFCLLVFSTVHSQIKYEQGYIIDHNGNKSDVLIQNAEWKANPSFVNYKTNLNADVRKGTVNEIKEFKVGNFHYVGVKVNVDQSSHITKDLSFDRNPEFKEETLFLRKLVEGPANLFVIDGSNIRYFYSTREKPIEQLISKRYNVNGRIARNNQFRQQLLSGLQCEGMNLSDVQHLDYRRESLINYFVQYNTCVDNSYVFESIKREGEFNFYFKGGVQFANLTVERGLNAKGVEMSGLGYRASVELEYVFPFNRNKWAAYFEPAYRTFSGEKKLTEVFNADLSAQYSSVELGLGVRHYFFLNEDSKLFLNLAYVYDVPVGSEVLFANTNRNMDPVLTDFNSSPSINVGVGLNFKNKYLVEARYGINQEFNGFLEVPENYYLDWRTKYSAVTLMVGYRFF
ncbi:autotransporter outer membrane beta-barrel domain-containing protein [Antarcticibacterium arcticum]|uniref:Autotransporter outer membrane beta-barrel domain-containing protein n=1 Tax=Antarcticibacterium arcticum TaxID=2585771 RepID=A0A5B8YNS0_9FLAO|nr:autotransporter outer membrane beta-barrel domain-containing protein [Antarcticibacterium arcticum]